MNAGRRHGADPAPVSITGLRLELGGIVERQPVPAAAAGMHINLGGQQANTLLHDGHAWKDYASAARSGIRRAMQAAQAGGAPMLVHASFAFVQAVEDGATLGPPLRAAAEAVLECETMALSGPVPACVVRLGYLYGPQSADLRAYRRAFRLGRPYWSGTSAALQYHLHQFDAASALLGAARLQNVGKVLYATDGTAVAFRTLMDAFAHRVGRPGPLHLPSWTRLIAHLIIREEHMQQVALAMPERSPQPRVPGWKPTFADYRKGLDQVVQAWSG
jgi:nucleoside-diphosphate-sugar epimerase